MFDLDRFVAACQACLTEHTPQLAVKELMEQTMSQPGQVEAALGTPTVGGMNTLQRAPDLTVLNIIWTPGMYLYPHDHQMWAVIGLYGGQENNTFYRREPEGLARAGSRELEAQDTVVLGDDVIHAVHNPRQVFSGAIHVYGGDFFAQPRSEWDSETLLERPYDVGRARRVFAEANERLARERDASANPG